MPIIGWQDNTCSMRHEVAGELSALSAEPFDRGLRCIWRRYRPRNSRLPAALAIARIGSPPSERYAHQADEHGLASNTQTSSRTYSNGTEQPMG